MASSCRQFYADISSNLKANNITDWISPMFVLSEARDIASDFLAKDHSAKFKLQRLSEGWDSIPCLSLEEVPVTECADIDARICQKLMKSIDRLPETYSYTFGDIIKHVCSVNYSNFYTWVTPRQWRDIQKREFKDKNTYYYFFQGGYLYIPIPKGETQIVEEIRVEAYFKDKYEVYLFNQKHGNCESCKDNCVKPLDFEFVAPYYMIDAIKTQILKNLSGLYIKIQESQNPDLSGDKNSQRVIENSKKGLIQ